MLSIKTIQSIPIRESYGRSLRYVLQPNDLVDNDPFVLLADDNFAHGTFADHPHKGIQTLTYVIKGNLRHFDNKTGGGGRLYEGDAQMMTSGSGIIHNEDPDEGESVRVLQLWINLSIEHKKLPSEYTDLKHEDVPTLEIDGGKVEVYAGQVENVASPIKQLTPVTFAIVSLEAGGEYNFPIHAGYNSYLYMLEGMATISERELNEYDIAHFNVSDQDDKVKIKAKTNMKCAIFAGEPIKEPVVARGPFVMNTEEEIMEAFRSYQQGTFI